MVSVSLVKQWSWRSVGAPVRDAKIKEAEPCLVIE